MGGSYLSAAIDRLFIVPVGGLFVADEIVCGIFQRDQIESREDLILILIVGMERTQM